MITVIVVDDQSLIRQAIVDLLDDEENISVVGQAVDGREGVQLALQNQPDIVLMDIRMPELDGISATAQICNKPEMTGTKVIMLTTFEEDKYVVDAMSSGASGFIGKGSEPGDIIRAVHAVHAGDSLLSAKATRALISRHTSSRMNDADKAKIDLLTRREREVLLMVSRGRNNHDIAEELYISQYTAKTHVNRIMAKLHAHDRAQLVVFAYETGLLSPGSAEGS